MIPCIDAMAISKNKTPITQSTMQTIVFCNKKSSDTSGLMRLAIPNKKVKKLIKREKASIIKLRKYDSLITGNFITSIYIKQFKKISYHFKLCNDIGQVSASSLLISFNSGHCPDKYSIDF